MSTGFFDTKENKILCEDFTHKGFDLFVLAVFKETFLETFAGDSGFYQFRIDSTQRIQIVFFYHCGFHLIQNTGVAHLRFFAVSRIAFSFHTGKGLFKDETHVQLSAPAEAFSEWQ